MIYQNYHRHSNYSIVVAGGDSVVKNEEYAKRAVELGHGIISGVEHGFQGRHVEGYELSKQYGLKFVFGSEAYWVKDAKEKDRTNNHIVLLAKNDNGRRALNVALSNAFIDGYYYVPRLGMDSILSLPRNDVWVTSACIGGWKYDDADSLWATMAEHFGENFFFELQYHNTPSQMALNFRVKNLAKEIGVKTIFGCDSHFIYPEQAKDRDLYLLSKGIVYDDEAGWFMDYPDGDVVIDRFKKQGILSESEIYECIENTNVLLDVEEYVSPVYDYEIKMPTLFPELSQNERNDIYKKLIWEKWDEEKRKISPSLWEKYEDEIHKEISIVENISHADYFLLDYAIVERGKELGGTITSTGRGSGVSFYTCKLLGLTKIDRISSPVKLYPERFLSETRILETKSLADLDLNLADPHIFATAQKEILGDEYSYPMIAWGTMREKEAWKMYSRAENVPFDVANDVSSQIDEFEFAVKHKDEDDDDPRMLDFIDEKYLEMVEKSSKYLGIYSNVKIHPCGYLIAPFNIREEAGLIAMKTAKGGQNVCALVDGLWAEKHKMVKNDLLKVNVVELYSRVYKRIGMNDTHDSSEIWRMFQSDVEMQRVYSDGIVMGVNQVEQQGTANRVKRYKPSNISELSAFIAAIRPGFSSMYDIFESREPFSYGVEKFDGIIQTQEMRNSFVLYQEQSMAALAYAGIPMTETYEIVKSIAKKRYDKVHKYREQFLRGFSERILSDDNSISEDSAMEMAEMVWKILDDSSRYSFNSSHSLSVATDSLYIAFLKSHYPIFFYEQFLQILEEKGEKDRITETESEARKFFGIRFLPIRFGQDNRKITASEKDNSITMSMASIKGFGHDIAENMFELQSLNFGNSFLGLLIYASEKSMVSKSKWEVLGKIGYFDEFGGRRKICRFMDEFFSGKSRYSTSHKDATKEKRIKELEALWNNIPNENFSVGEIVSHEMDVFGEPKTALNVDRRLAVVISENDYEGKFSPRLGLKFLNSGKFGSLKVSKRGYQKVSIGDFLMCKKFEEKDAVKFTKENGFVPIPDQKVWWLTDYNVISDIDRYLKQV